MLAFARAALPDSDLRSPALIALGRSLNRLTDSRWTVYLLLALGVTRTLIFLIAYPPAHGADSADYFLFAAQFAGLDAPVVFELIYPLYPVLVYLTHYWMGSIYVLVIFQLVLSALQGVVFYWGIRPYSPALALGVALLVLADPQTGILYNFTATEPLYMFALSLAFSLFLIQVRRRGKRLQAGDVLLGVALALTLLIRPVGRYLIIPFALLFLLSTRSVWRTAVVGAAFALILILSALFNQLVFDQFAVKGGGSFMLVRPLTRTGLLQAENGPASAELVALRESCPDPDTMNQCLVTLLGNWPAVSDLYNRAYREMLRAHPLELGEQVFADFTDYLRQPGLQYQGKWLPSDAQCEDIEAKVARDTPAYLEKDFLLHGASDITAETLAPIVRDIASAMCPPWPDSWTVRRAVDQVAVRYRSLSRPHPYLWYGALGALVLIVPRARRLWPLVLVTGAIVANHAAASAIMFNVQPRYIAIVNPYKGVLLLVLFYVGGVLVLHLADKLLARNR